MLADNRNLFYWHEGMKTLSLMVNIEPKICVPNVPKQISDEKQKRLFLIYLETGIIFR